VAGQAGRPRLEVADILRRHAGDYLRAHQPSAAQLAVMRHLQECRTAALGGHVDTCDTCDYVRISYNSCRDRHCPKCQSLKKAEWLEARRERLLPVPYFHVVFTLPEELRPLALRNKRTLFDILFHSAANTLLAIAADQKHLGAQIGFTAVLHTWTQKLDFHPHLHCVVTGGGLAPDGQRWISRSPDFFLPVKVLRRLFRGKFLHALATARDEGELEFEGSTAALHDQRTWRRLLDQLYSTEWVVYAKPPFGGPEHVFRYLGRYTHRVAIANHRLVSLADGQVQFRFRDRADGARSKILSLDAVEFLRRFLLHVLPKRFIRIRHYGLLAGRNVHTKLLQARRLLEGNSTTPHPDPPAVPLTDLDWSERLLQLTGVDIFACPACRTGRLASVPFEPGDIPLSAVPTPEPVDSS